MGPDQEALLNSKINAREFWIIHANDKTKDKTPSRRIYLDKQKAQLHCMEVAAKEPDKKIYLLKCEEVFKYDSEKDTLIREIIDDLKK